MYLETKKLITNNYYSVKDIINISNKLLEKGSKSEAIFFLESSKAIHPNTSEIFYNLGCIYLKEKKYNFALREFKKAVKLDNLNKDYNLNLVLTYFASINILIEKKIYNKAITYLKVVEKILIKIKSPELLTEPYLKLGYCYQVIKKFDKLIKIFIGFCRKCRSLRYRLPTIRQHQQHYRLLQKNTTTTKTSTTAAASTATTTSGTSGTSTRTSTTIITTTRTSSTLTTGTDTPTSTTTTPTTGTGSTLSSTTSTTTALTIGLTSTNARPPNTMPPEEGTSSKSKRSTNVWLLVGAAAAVLLIAAVACVAVKARASTSQKMGTSAAAFTKNL